MHTFQREVFIELLKKDRALRGETEAAWAKRNKIGTGTIHDITRLDPDSGRPRRTPGPELIKRLADGLSVPIGVLIYPASEKVS